MTLNIAALYRPYRGSHGEPTPHATDATPHATDPWHNMLSFCLTHLL